MSESTHCYPAYILLIIWGLLFLAAFLAKGSFSWPIFIFITVIIVGFSKFIKYLCNRGYRVLSWLVIFAPFLLYYFIFWYSYGRHMNQKHK